MSKIDESRARASMLVLTNWERSTESEGRSGPIRSEGPKKPPDSAKLLEAYADLHTYCHDAGLTVEAFMSRVPELVAQTREGLKPAPGAPLPAAALFEQLRVAWRKAYPDGKQALAALADKLPTLWDCVCQADTRIREGGSEREFYLLGLGTRRDRLEFAAMLQAILHAQEQSGGPQATDGPPISGVSAALRSWLGEGESYESWSAGESPTFLEELGSKSVSQIGPEALAMANYALRLFTNAPSLTLTSQNHEHVLEVQRELDLVVEPPRPSEPFAPKALHAAVRAQWIHQDQREEEREAERIWRFLEPARNLEPHQMFYDTGTGGQALDKIADLPYRDRLRCAHMYRHHLSSADDSGFSPPGLFVPFLRQALHNVPSLLEPEQRAFTAFQERIGLIKPQSS